MVSAVMLSNAKQLYRVLLSRLNGVKEGTFIFALPICFQRSLATLIACENKFLPIRLHNIAFSEV